MHPSLSADNSFDSYVTATDVIIKIDEDEEEIAHGTALDTCFSFRVPYFNKKIKVSYCNSFKFTVGNELIFVIMMAYHVFQLVLETRA